MKYKKKINEKKEKIIVKDTNKKNMTKQKRVKNLKVKMEKKPNYKYKNGAKK